MFFHMFTNDGDTEGLFRAGIMNSGTSAATGDVTELQDTFDYVVQQVGCANATDALACLRSVPAESLVAVADTTTAVTDYKVSDSVGACGRMLISDSDFRVYRDLRIFLARTVSLSRNPRRTFSHKAGQRTYRLSSVRPNCEQCNIVTLMTSVGDVRDEGTMFSVASLNITWVTSIVSSH